MYRRRSRKQQRRALWAALTALAAFLALSLALVGHIPRWAAGIGFIDGLAVGLVLGATGLVAGYDDAWQEFWQTTALTATLGIFALVVYWFRQEEPPAFFWVEFAAALVGYAMLFFISPLEWIGADVLIFFGTFVGWFFSSLFRPVC